MKILLLGKNGQVGKSLVENVDNKQLLISYDSSELNFCNEKIVGDQIRKDKPDFIINAAAYTNVDQAEKEKSKCFQLNANAVKEIANVAKEINSIFIHFSSDYVFNGTLSRPYREIDNPDPINIYGKSKLKGEESIIKSSCNFYILRTSWVVSENGNNFINTMIKLFNTKNKIEIVSDQYGAPTTSDFIAKNVYKLIRKNFTGSQIFNLTPNSYTNWYSLAKYTHAKLKKLNQDIPRVTFKELNSEGFETLAKRPLNSRLDSSKIQKFLNTKFLNWENYIEELLDKKFK